MASDTPLRTIKTVLHTLTTIFGDQVLTFVGLIENADKTELWAYLMKVLMNTGGQPTLNLAEHRPRPEGASPTAGKHTLAEIFKKIGTKENTKEVGWGIGEWNQFDI